MQLYSFFNSSTSYRVRIALALKAVAYDTVPINIRTLEHRAEHYVNDVNPSANVPLLHEGDMKLGQSLAIIDYLDSAHPEPRLIPQDSVQRARVLELADVIACEMHPVNNLRILKYLQGVLKVSDEQKNAWYRHWVDDGMATIERLLTRYGKGPYCFGTAPTLADCCLVPQMANAKRMGCDMRPYPRALAVFEHCTAQPAFQQAEPARQPDYTL
jgi:maleylacetoacetate isomerase